MRGACRTRPGVVLGMNAAGTKKAVSSSTWSMGDGMDGINK